jgi:hypothetical protein
MWRLGKPTSSVAGPSFAGARHFSFEPATSAGTRCKCSGNAFESSAFGGR